MVRDRTTTRTTGVRRRDARERFRRYRSDASASASDRSVALTLAVGPGQAVVTLRSRGVLPVVVDGSDADAIALDSLRFAAPATLADGGGVRLAHGGHRTGRGPVLHFPVQRTGFDEDTSVARLVGRVDPSGSSREQSVSGTDEITVVGPPDDDGRDDDHPGRGNGNSDGPDGNADDYGYGDYGYDDEGRDDDHERDDDDDERDD